MHLDLKGKTVLVTGGLRGIGGAVSESCAAAGAKVIATYLNSDTLAASFLSKMKSRNFDAHVYKMDVRSSESVNKVMTEIEAAHGPVSVLVNNAGVVRDNLLLSMEDLEWRDVMDTNLDGAFRMIRSVARQMVRARKGVIINISSVAASRPGRGQANYAASKGGIEAMTKALAVELSTKGIRVNAIAPGVIETEMSRDVREAAGDKILESVLLKRFGKPEDISAAVVFLASDFASYITGEVLHIDGGLKL
ncbi:MAG: 3-oxoacyl-ACP reductase FabG [Proteobacteria bacterium]|nr:3-oxoacyl-ACP reductase FabG [Pseudomonadota bacterium]